MIEAISFKALISNLREKYDDATEVPIGILIGNANNSFMEDSILKRIDYYHHRSNKNVDFYFPGYGAYWHGHYGPQTTVCTVNGVEWLFSDKLFVEFVEELETISKWEYTGEVELLILNYRNGYLDFSEVIIFWLDKMVNEGVIYSPANLFEKIFRKFSKAKSVNFISNTLTLGFITNEIIKEILIGVPIAKEFIKGRHYCTRNLSR